MFGTGKDGGFLKPTLRKAISRSSAAAGASDSNGNCFLGALMNSALMQRRDSLKPGGESSDEEDLEDQDW